MDQKPQNNWQTDENQLAQPQSLEQPQPPATPETLTEPTPQEPPQFAAATPALDLENSTDQADADMPEVAWRASEYIHHEKGALWYVVLAVITLLGVGLTVIFQQWILAVLVAVMGIAIGVYASRPPQEIAYRLAPEGLYIQDRLLPYESFRSFGIVDDGAFYALQLRPSKRFLPGVTVYFAEADGERIVDALSTQLPMEEIRIDLVDRLMRWLRF